MYAILVSLFVVLSFLLIVVILLQAGKGKGLSGAIGGGMAGQSVFGGRGAGDFLTKATTYMVVIYVALALVIGITYKSDSGEGQPSLIQQEMQKQQNVDEASSLPVNSDAQPAEETPAE